MCGELVLDEFSAGASSAPRWFVLRTGSMQRSVARALQAKGFEVFIPTQTRRHQEPGHVKIVQVPIFRGVVFCRYCPKDWLTVLSTPGIFPDPGRRRGRPVSIPDAEIERLRQLCACPYVAEECCPPVELGIKVCLKEDRTVWGFLVERGPICRVVVHCEGIGRAILLRMPLVALEPL